MVTSLDDGSIPQDQPHDEVRRAAPADPWLTEAPTSPISDATTLQEFDAVHTVTQPTPGATPPGPMTTQHAPATAAQPGLTTVHTGPAPFPGWYQPARDRRRRRLTVTALALGAVFLATVLAVDQFRSNDDDTAAPRPPATTTTAATKPEATTQPTASTGPGSATGTAAAPVRPAANPPASPGPQVVYEVTASGKNNIGSVNYTDQDGTIIRRNGIPLPWRTAFPAGTPQWQLVIDAQRTGGGDAGPVTCTITVDGKVLSTTTSEGRSAAVLC